MKEIIKEFKSIHEFVNYINTTPTNNIFAGSILSSKEDDYIAKAFTNTNSYEEAINLITHGWSEKAKEMEAMFKLQNKSLANKTVSRAQYDVVGGQVSVPRYLQGVPTSMINKKQVTQKQKVITIVKHVGYLANVSTDQILENSIKALQIVKIIEDKGIRVNLDVMSPAEIFSGEKIICRVRIKSANERLNISKIAFPMAHPSMLRRLVFRLREVAPEITNYGWRGSYGATIYDRNKVKKYLNKGEYYLHNFIDNIETEIKNMGL